MRTHKVSEDFSRDAANIAKAGTFQHSTAWRDAVDEWVRETYGARAIKIGQRYYAPDTEIIDAPKWSILNRSETATEKRARLMAKKG